MILGSPIADAEAIDLLKSETPIPYFLFQCFNSKTLQCPILYT